MWWLIVLVRGVSTYWVLLHIQAHERKMDSPSVLVAIFSVFGEIIFARGSLGATLAAMVPHDQLLDAKLLNHLLHDHLLRFDQSTLALLKIFAQLIETLFLF